MPSADTTSVRAYTSDEHQAYERYISAVADHNIVCARRDATTREKMDAAFTIDRHYRAFCEVAGLAIGGTHNVDDVRRIKHLETELGVIVEAARSVGAMLSGVDALDVFTTVAEGADYQDFCDATVLLNDAGTLLRAAMKRADAA